MKKSLFYILLATAGLTLQSCLDYDQPGDEFSSDRTVVDKDTHKGNIDSLNYTLQITPEQFESVNEHLQNYYGVSLSAQYALRGGKDNSMPGSHAYQYQYNLGPDNYAGYFVVSHQDFPYSNATLTSTYNVCEQFNGGPRGNYTIVKNALMPLLHHASVDSIPEVKAVNLLYYCIAAQEVADISGPFTYYEDKENLENPTTYVPLDSIYYGIEANLDTIVNCLKHFEQRPDWYKEELLNIFIDYQTSRCALTGDYSRFVESCWRLANSLKLRMAMHMAKVDPARAQKWAEEAVESGVVESEDMQHALYPAVSGFTNPLVEIAGSWADTRLNASFESLLMSLDHPYTHMLWQKNAYSITNKHSSEVTPANDRIVGLRAGCATGQGQSISTNPNIAASTFDPNMMANAPLYLVKWAEVDFLRAEGALRGWNMGGTAEYFYERGIRNAALDEPQDRIYYEEDGVDGYDNYVDDYMQRTEAIEYIQRDPFGDGKDWESLTRIGVKWNEADTREVKLEKIMTQKYIALFPLSTEAWTELRRTGYPQIFPVMWPSDGDGSLAEGDLIRRVPWAATDPQAKANIQATGLNALGGDDLQATRLWWDVEGPNF